MRPYRDNCIYAMRAAEIAALVRVVARRQELSP
jgi:hypothetical protein